MRFLLNKRLHVNMSNYEHVEITASVEVDTIADTETLVDLGVNPGQPESVMDFVREQLDVFLGPGIEEAATYTDHEESFILPYSEDREKKQRKRN